MDSTRTSRDRHFWVHGLDRRKSRLVLHSHRGDYRSLRRSYRTATRRQYPFRSGPFSTEVPVVYVCFHAVRRRHWRRPDVFLHCWASNKLSHPASRNPTFGRSRTHGSNLDHVPLRHSRLGNVRTHGHRPWSFCVPLPLTAEYSLSPSSHLRQAHPRRRWKCRRHHRNVGHDFRHRHLTRYRCCIPQLRTLGAVRASNHRGSAGRSDRAVYINHDLLRGLLCLLGYSAVIRAQRTSRPRPAVMDFGHRENRRTTRTTGTKYWRLLLPLPWHAAQ